ncbi:MAG: Flp pilus assembly protein CpaB [Burkholderiaceae bacterium]
MLAAALAFGSLGVFATQGYIAASLEEERARLAESARTVGVIVAAAALRAGSAVDVDTMAVRQLPVRGIDAAMIRAEDFDQVQGQQIVLPMASGEPLRRSSLRQRHDPFSSKVALGIRALTIEVDEVNSVSGMLRPGDRIDLLFSTHAALGAGRAAGAIAAPLMQDLLILATGTQAAAGLVDDDGARFGSITVEVTPTQAQKLVLAQRSGRLTALLRNPGDRHAMPQGMMDLNTLLGLPGRKPVTPGPEQPEIIVGGRGQLVPMGGLGSQGQQP